MVEFVEHFPSWLRVPGLLAIAAYFAVPTIRQFLLETRLRTQELARDRSRLEIVKLQYEIEALRHGLLEGSGAPPSSSIAPSPTWLPDLKEFASRLSIYQEPPDPGPRLPFGRRVILGLIGAIPLGVLFAYASWENDPGPTAVGLTAWCLIGVATALVLGGRGPSRAVMAGILGPFAFNLALNALSAVNGTT